MSTDSFVPMLFAGQNPYQRISEEVYPEPNSPPKKWKSFKTSILRVILGAILASTLLYYAYIKSGPQVNRDLSTHRPRIAVSHESDHSATRTSPLPTCSRTFLFKFSSLFGLGSELGLLEVELYHSHR
ncbi:hypothetical protein CROQUDRAFT_95235 [Cronartium quercuum f. sp. fusiforme G11]|uniref:Uncharacterized protein n=1 Tax=Cronartium quercuum f. sp. fusiforme G11 TaxID=708437 RepID=A0A9P6NDR8_9BASI|nr:hypothetical protein CROQUDRAFT_95235 [Cronartium quercuum f. sp. fusiforme G11]